MGSRSSFVIKTYLNNLLRRVIIYEDEKESLDRETFSRRALNEYDLSRNEVIDDEVDLIDADGMSLTMNDIWQYKNCSRFHVRIVLNVSRKKIELIAESLTNFAVQKGLDDVLKKGKTVTGLTKQARMAFVNCLAKFIEDEYESPTTEIIETVCKAAIVVCPCLECKNSLIGGIDSLYNKAKKNGYLFDHIRNKKRSNKRKLDDANDKEAVAAMEMSEKEVMTYFKQCLVPQQLTEVKQKMIETKDVRQHIIKNKPSKYEDMWGFLFVEPQLMLLDFGIMIETTNENGLEQWWDTIKNIPEEFGIVVSEKECKAIKKHDDIHKVMAYLKLLRGNHAFSKSAAQFLVISEDSNEDVMVLRNRRLKYPYILAKFSEMSDSALYFIDIQTGFFPMPKDYSFIKTVEFFLKMHNVLHYDYGPGFQNTFFIFEYVLYGMSTSKQYIKTPIMKQVAERLMKLKENNNDLQL